MRPVIPTAVTSTSANHHQQQQQQLSQVLYQLRTCTDPSTVAAAVTDVHDIVNSLLDQQLQLDSQQQQELLDGLVPVLQRQQGEAALTAVAPLLCVLSGSVPGQQQLQPHLPILLDAFLQHTDHAATSSLSVTVENVAGFAADHQQLRQQHLQPLLQAALQCQPSAGAAASSNGGGVVSNSSASSSCGWRQHSAQRLVTHLAMREEVQQLLAQQLPWLLQQPLAVQNSPCSYNIAAAGAVFKIIRYLVTFSEAAEAIVQHAQQLLAAVLRLCQAAEQLQLERQWQYKHNAVLADAAATVLALLHHHAAQVQLEQQHLCSTVECLLAVCGQLQQHSNTLAQPLKQCIEQLTKLAAVPDGAGVLCEQPYLQQLLAATDVELSRPVQPQQQQLLNVVQELAAAAAAEGKVPSALAAQVITWLQQQLDRHRQATDLQHHQQQQPAGSKSDEDDDEDEAGPTVDAWQQQRMACERSAALVQCLAPLAEYEAGWAALLPHAALLQAAAAAVPELQEQVQQMTCPEPQLR